MRIKLGLKKLLWFFFRSGPGIRTWYLDLSSNEPVDFFVSVKDLRYIVLGNPKLDLRDWNANSDIDILVDPQDLKAFTSSLTRRKPRQSVVFDVYTVDGSRGCGWRGCPYVPVELGKAALESFQNDGLGAKHPLEEFNREIVLFHLLYHKRPAYLTLPKAAKKLADVGFDLSLGSLDWSPRDAIERLRQSSSYPSHLGDCRSPAHQKWIHAGIKTR